MDFNTRHGQLTPEDLLSLEQYAKQRSVLRTKIIAHKKLRSVALGPNATVLFEDRLLVQYQIQEMLRAERIFEAEGILDELNAYNPLIPDSYNLKATLLIEFVDPAERQLALMRLRGFEQHVYFKVADEKVLAIADEDLERETDDKTSAVHFLRFEFADRTRQTVLSGTPLELCVNHPQYQYCVKINSDTQASLLGDLQGV